jgi:hypothetical protein
LLTNDKTNDDLVNTVVSEYQYGSSNNENGESSKPSGTGSTNKVYDQNSNVGDSGSGHSTKIGISTKADKYKDVTYTVTNPITTYLNISIALNSSVVNSCNGIPTEVQHNMTLNSQCSDMLVTLSDLSAQMKSEALTACNNTCKIDVSYCKTISKNCEISISLETTVLNDLRNTATGINGAVSNIVSNSPVIISSQITSSFVNNAPPAAIKIDKVAVARKNKYKESSAQPRTFSLYLGVTPPPQIAFGGVVNFVIELEHVYEHTLLLVSSALEKDILENSKMSALCKNTVRSDEKCVRVEMNYNITKVPVIEQELEVIANPEFIIPDVNITVVPTLNGTNVTGINGTNGTVIIHTPPISTQTIIHFM